MQYWNAWQVRCARNLIMNTYFSNRSDFRTRWSRHGSARTPGSGFLIFGFVLIRTAVFTYLHPPPSPRNDLFSILFFFLMTKGSGISPQCINTLQFGLHLSRTPDSLVSRSVNITDGCAFISVQIRFDSMTS